MNELAERKARGAFFTPPALTRFIANWAIRSEHDTVLEPSCGEAAFLLAAAAKLSLLGAKLSHPVQLRGVELHQSSALAAASLLENAGVVATIDTGDFFCQDPADTVDVVIGNPPFIRYQEFTGDVRARSLEAAFSQGVRLSGLASSWAAFTVHASRFLQPQGRLGLVLPGELLTVGYAAEVRKFLLRRFSRVRLVLFEQRVFPNVLEDTVLLLAEGTGGASHFDVYQAKSADDLVNLTIKGWTDHRPDASDKWTPALIDSSSYDAFASVCDSTNVASLDNWGSAYLGAVTGDNKYFAMNSAKVRELGLSQDDVSPISPPGARHLRGLTLSSEAWRSLGAEGKPCSLFTPGERLSKAAEAYVISGQDQNVDQAYKCKMRKPWWRVPMVRRPDFLLTYMNHDRLRFVENRAGLSIINSVYGFTLDPLVRKEAATHLPLALLNSVTLLSAELTGRMHGGGMLKHEPRQIGKLAAPSPECLMNATAALSTLEPQIGRLLRKNDAETAIELVDRALLKEVIGMPDTALAAVREARRHLLGRRLAKSGLQ